MSVTLVFVQAVAGLILLRLASRCSCCFIFSRMSPIVMLSSTLTVRTRLSTLVQIVLIAFTTVPGLACCPTMLAVLASVPTILPGSSGVR